MNNFQQPIKLDAIIVDPMKDQLSHNGEVIDVQSMAMKVLCYFANNQGQLISRDDLRNNVWKNTTTSDHTINNHIYSLRRTLAKLTPDVKYIHTVTGSNGNGYRLLTPIESTSISIENPAIEQPSLRPDLAQESAKTITSIQKDIYSTAINTSPSRARIIWMTLLVVSVVLLGIFIATMWKASPVNYQHVTPLTNELGREQSPAISEDGEFIIYAHRYKSDSQRSKWELYAKRLSSPNTATKVFSDLYTNDNFVSISPDNRYITFIRYKTGEKGIYIADFNRKTLTAKNAKLIIKLDEVNVTTAISWLSSNQFYYSAREAVNAPLRVYLYDVALDTSEQITSPPIDSFGDMSLIVSPDKSLLAIMRAEGKAGYQLYLKDIKKDILVKIPIESSENRLYVSFDDDSQSIFYISENGYLTQYHINTQTFEQISDRQYIGYWPLKVSRKNQFIMQQEWGLSSLTTQIVRYGNPLLGVDALPTVVVNNGLSIRSIEGIANDGLLFASIKPNHHVELWRYQENHAEKLPEFSENPTFRYPLSLHWLQGTNKALLSINNTCLLVDVHTGKNSPLCPANEKVFAGRFSHDGHSILLPSDDRGVAATVRMGASGYPFETLGDLPNTNAVVQASSHNYYYSDQPSFDIYHYNALTKQHTKLIDRTYVHNRFSVNDFVVTKRGIYFMDRIKVTQNGIYFYDFNTQEVQYVLKSKDNYPNIVVSSDEQFIYLIESVDNDSKLLLVE